jgi:hypothetical protein
LAFINQEYTLEAMRPSLVHKPAGATVVHPRL